MAFRGANLSRLVKFNSATSSDFIDSYEKFWEDKIASQNNQPKHKTFAPSSFRCPRVSWFRLRGVQPDAMKNPDMTLDFTAIVGTAVHENIQENLESMLGHDWIDVGYHLQEIAPNWEYQIEKRGHETLIEISNPPVRFACDGIIRLNGKKYLLEIKTSEYASFDELTNPKERHMDQVKFYCTMLQLDGALVLYVDRQYGGLKCYEMTVTDSDKKYIWDKINYIMECVDTMIAPERLPKDDINCNPNMCPYYKRCKEWG